MPDFAHVVGRVGDQPHVLGDERVPAEADHGVGGTMETRVVVRDGAFHPVDGGGAVGIRKPQIARIHTDFFDCLLSLLCLS